MKLKLFAFGQTAHRRRRRRLISSQKLAPCAGDSGKKPANPETETPGLKEEQEACLVNQDLRAYFLPEPPSGHSSGPFSKKCCKL